jgi:hypothetical protein
LGLPFACGTSAWIHGDGAHLAGNALGAALLGAPLALAFGVDRVLFLLALACLVTSFTGAALGNLSMGASGGVWALAGGLLRRGNGRVRILGPAWIALGLLGGLGSGRVDNLSHLLGAALGVLVLPAAFRPRTLRQLCKPSLGALSALLMLASLVQVVRGIEPAVVETRSSLPQLQQLERGSALIEALVAWSGERHQALDALLEAAREEQPLGPVAATLARSLAQPDEIVSLRRAAAPGLEVELRPPPPPFDGNPNTWSMDESQRRAWKGLLDYLAAEDAALEAAASRLAAQSHEVYHSPPTQGGGGT